MRVPVACFLAILGIASSNSAFAQVRPNRIHVFTERPRLISGEQTQVFAAARNTDGTLRTNDEFNWRSNNPSIATVDSTGLVTARGLGITEIVASLGGVNSSNLRLQVLPLRIDVSPSSRVIIIGEPVQFQASALNVDEQPIAGVNFQWQVIGAGGFLTQAVRIDSTGALVANAVGAFTVVASVNYPAGQGQFLTQSVGRAPIEVRAPAAFRLTRLLSSEEVLPSALLLPPGGNYGIAVNDAGQLAFNASLSGMTSGLMLYDKGVFDLLVGTGTQGPLPGGIIRSVDAPVINNRGEVLVRVGIDGQPGGALVLASRQGKSFVLSDGESVSSFENIRLCCKFLLNDEGQIAFRGQFQWANDPAQQEGLFLRSEAGLDLAWWPGEPLPGLPGARFIDELGLDRAGTLYFNARSDTASGIYRRERFQIPVKILGTGDSFAGSNVRNVIKLSAAPDGTLAFVVEVESGQNYLARVTAARTENIPLRGGIDRVVAGSGGAVAFTADLGNGWGLHRWQSSLSMMLAVGRLAPNGEPIRSINSIAITADGKVFAQLATVENEFVVIQAGAVQALLFQAGNQVNVAASMTITGLTAGSATGEPHLLLGGWPPNLFALNPRGPVPRLISGDRLPGRVSFIGIEGGVYENSHGLYFGSVGSIYRIAGGRTDVLFARNTLAVDGVTPGWFDLQAINDNGLALLNAWSDARRRLLLADNGRLTVLAFGNGSPPWQTQSPAGGTIRDWPWQLHAVDVLGRVMTFFNVDNGPSGLFLYENGGWRAAGLVDTTTIGNQTITNINQVKAVNDRFYAVLNLSGGGNILAEYRNYEWIPLVSRGDTGPNGAEINAIRNFAVNRRGDIAFDAWFNGGVIGLVLRTADGMRMIESSAAPTEAGDYIMSISNVVLADDRRVYFIGQTLSDRSMVYVAEPIF